MKHIYSLERLKQSVINFLEHVVVPTLTIFYRIIEYIYSLILQFFSVAIFCNQYIWSGGGDILSWNTYNLLLVRDSEWLN